MVVKEEGEKGKEETEQFENFFFSSHSSLYER